MKLGLVAVLAASLAACLTPAQTAAAVDAAKTLECVLSTSTSAEAVAKCVTENVSPADIIHLFEKTQADRKAAFAQGKLEGEHVGCAPKDGPLR